MTTITGMIESIIKGTLTDECTFVANQQAPNGVIRSIRFQFFSATPGEFAQGQHVTMTIQ